MTAADDTDLIPLGSETHGYTGRFNAQVYARVSTPTTWHLRLDDGHRFVGLDLTDVGGRQDPITDELGARVREAWQRLERELTDPAHQWEGWTDPWGDVMSAALSPGAAVVIVRPSDDGLSAELAVYRPRIARARRSFHNHPVQAVDVSAGSLASAALRAQEGVRPLGEAMEVLMRQAGERLSDWQRNVVEQMAAMQFLPRQFRGGAVQDYLSWLGFRPLVNARDAAVLEQAGMREGQHFLRYLTPEPTETPADPMLRAIEAKRNRNTGPPTDRLDGRRRRR
ncbi:hypothetical protein ABZY58_11880 [Micromonospora tulbaghiae]|uniref:hypothetical protein n=1 Tax=Micromonospora tulbaghiae TaxID=479978 RepID=UPI0033AC2FB7